MSGDWDFLKDLRTEKNARRPNSETFARPAPGAPHPPERSRATVPKSEPRTERITASAAAAAEKIVPAYTWVRQTLGILLGVLVVGHILLVTFMGGLYNPDTPKTTRDVQTGLIEHITKSQDIDEIRENSALSDQEYVARGRMQIKMAYRHLNETIKRHETLARSDLPTQQEYDFHVGSRLSEQLGNHFGSRYIRMTGVSPMTLRMDEDVLDAEYTALFASNVPAEELFDRYLTLVHEEGHYIAETLRTDDNRFFYIDGDSDESDCTIIICEKETFPGYKVTVLQMLSVEFEETNF